MKHDIQGFFSQLSGTCKTKFVQHQDSTATNPISYYTNHHFGQNLLLLEASIPNMSEI